MGNFADSENDSVLLNSSNELNLALKQKPDKFLRLNTIGNKKFSLGIAMLKFSTLFPFLTASKHHFGNNCLEGISRYLKLMEIMLSIYYCCAISDDRFNNFQAIKEPTIHCDVSYFQFLRNCWFENFHIC